MEYYVIDLRDIIKTESGRFLVTKEWLKKFRHFYLGSDGITEEFYAESLRQIIDLDKPYDDARIIQKVTKYVEIGYNQATDDLNTESLLESFTYVRIKEMSFHGQYEKIMQKVKMNVDRINPGNRVYVETSLGDFGCFSYYEAEDVSYDILSLEVINAQGTFKKTPFVPSVMFPSLGINKPTDFGERSILLFLLYKLKKDKCSSREDKYSVKAGAGFCDSYNKYLGLDCTYTKNDMEQLVMGNEYNYRPGIFMSGLAECTDYPLYT